MKYNDNGAWKELNVKVSDTLPIGSIVEYDGDTVPIGYEEVNSYSTNEVKTGDTWIDGKPIYRKVWAFELSNNADLDGNLGLTNTNNFWVNEGKSFIKSPDQSLPANFYYSSSDWARTWLYKSSSFIHYRFKSPSDLYGYTLYITVEYTKNTD